MCGFVRGKIAITNVATWTLIYAGLWAHSMQVLIVRRSTRGPDGLMLGHDLAAPLPCRLLASRGPICNAGKRSSEDSRLIQRGTMAWSLSCIVAQLGEGR